MKSYKTEVQKGLEKISFDFPNRHHYTDTDSTEEKTENYLIKLKVEVFFSDDLEDIKDIEVLYFNVYDNEGNEIDTTISDKMIKKLINY